jgi:hypothetical protein
MRALVDFDNVPDPIRSQGPLYLADRLFERLKPHLAGDPHIQMKLYGGWYQQDRLTKNAQNLLAQLGLFPYPLWITDVSPAQLVRINAELAHSLEALPKKHLHGTLRFRPPARRFMCEDPRANGCTSTTCPISAIADFVNKKQCTEAGCSVTPKLLFRGVAEQKLVDSMLVADIIHLSSIGERAVAIVTSDDDVWPGIISALVGGTHVIHLRSGSGSSGASYTDSVPGKYTELSL